jgi:mannosyltransferase OCH1-like enzyme
MIPKTLHYCWYSNDAVPGIAAGNLDNWKKVLGDDYKIIKWDAAKIAEEIPEPNEFLQYALDNKKYAFISDYIRYFSVHKYGGIYLDMDVRLFKNFDQFLDKKFFGGWELWNNNEAINTVTAHCFGALAGNQYLSQIIDSYNRSYDETLAPVVMRTILIDHYGLTGEIDKSEFWNEGDLTIYPYYYFDKQKTLQHFNSGIAHHQHMNSWVK